MFSSRLLCLETYRCNPVLFCITFTVVGSVFVHAELEYCIVIVIQLGRHFCMILLVACLYS